MGAQTPQGGFSVPATPSSGAAGMGAWGGGSTPVSNFSSGFGGSNGQSQSNQQSQGMPWQPTQVQNPPWYNGNMYGSPQPPAAVPQPQPSYYIDQFQSRPPTLPAGGGNWQPQGYRPMNESSGLFQFDNSQINANGVGVNPIFAQRRQAAEAQAQAAAAQRAAAAQAAAVSANPWLASNAMRPWEQYGQQGTDFGAGGGGGGGGE